MNRENTAGPLAVMVAAAVGCGPSMPTQTEARAAFVERRAKVEAFEETIFRMISMFPELAEHDLDPAVDAAGALGFTGPPGLPPVHPCIGGVKHGSVDPDQGVAVDHYRIGYGLYQTAWEQDGVSHGDGDYHPGIAVRWRVEGSVFTEPFTLCFLLDGTPRPK